MIAIFGADSKIGRQLNANLEGCSIPFSRRRGKSVSRYFDLEKIDQLNLAGLNAKIAIICAGYTNIEFCQKNPKLSFQVNCCATIKLIDKLNDFNIPVLILSSNSVFGQYAKEPQENQYNYAPTCRYALHKSVIDDYVINNYYKNIVVRITKVVSEESIFFDVISAIREKKPVHLYNNLNLSPISMKYLTTMILKVINSDQAGVFHLSGSNTYSYYELGVEIGKVLNGLNSDLSNIIGVREDKNLYLPNNAQLGMDRTRNMLSIEPQNLNSFIADLLGETVDFL